MDLVKILGMICLTFKMQALVDFKVSSLNSLRVSRKRGPSWSAGIWLMLSRSFFHFSSRFLRI